MKKRTLNKLFSISLTAAMALGMLSGCGNTASNTDTASPAETGTATTESTDTVSSGDKTTMLKSQSQILQVANTVTKQILRCPTTK